MTIQQHTVILDIQKRLNKNSIAIWENLSCSKKCYYAQKVISGKSTISDIVALLEGEDNEY